MATKPRNFDPQLYYHIYNRGVEKRSTFKNVRDYQRFLETTLFYRYDQKISYATFQRLGPKAQMLYRQTNPEGLSNQRIGIAAYCLMPNHFHFLLKPVEPAGVTKFIADVTNSYTKYFNIKNERTGYLFQSTFKAKEIRSEPSLLQLSRYIHLNPLLSSQTNPEGLFQQLEEYPYSSYPEWLGLRKPYLTDKEEVTKWVDYSGGPENYQEFVEAKVEKDPALGIEDLTLE